MTGPPRDWDKELAAIDKAIDRQGTEPAAHPAVRPPADAVAVAAAPRRGVALAWFWTGLGLLLGIALPLWPYEKGCGLQLTFYLGAAGLAFLVALWAALASWRFRRGVAHVLSLLLVVWTVILVATEVLPRIGYAKVSKAWLCQTPPQNPSPAPVLPRPAP